MTSKPWMPLYIADYLADTAHLGALQSGAYLHLIMHYWQHNGLPDNDAALMRIARLTPTEWKRERPVLAAFFHDGWKHKRIDAELAHAAQVSSKRRDAAEQRRSKNDANDDAIAESKAKQLHKQKHPHARGLSQSQPQEGSVSDASASSTAPPDEWSDDRQRLFGGALQWLRKQTGRKLEACRSLIARWLKLTGDDATALLGLIRQARDRDLAEPIAWIEAALHPKTNGHTTPVDWTEYAEIYRRLGRWPAFLGPAAAIPAEHRHLFPDLFTAATTAH